MKSNSISKSDKKPKAQKGLTTRFQLIKKPFFAVTMLLLAAVCLTVYAWIPEYSYRLQAGKVQFENPESFCTSQEGWTAVVDDKDRIYCLDEEGTLVYAVDKNQFSYNDMEILDIAFGPDHYLFCQVAIYNESAYLTDGEVILEISPTGTIGREILYYDYRDTDDAPSHQARIRGLHFYENHLCYLYTEENGSTLYQINLKTSQPDEKIFLPKDGFCEITQCHGQREGGYLVLKNNGEIGSISPEGKYTAIYKAEYNARNNQGLFPCDVFMEEDRLYMLAGQNSLSLYTWNNQDWKMILPIKKSIQLSEDTDLYSFGLGDYGHRLGLNINESIYTLEDENTLQPYNGGFLLPVHIRVFMWLKSFLPIIGLLFFISGIISGIGNLMGWRLSILSKQLLSTIPIVLIMLIVITVSMLYSMINLNTEDILHETIAVNEIAASLFEGEALETMTGYESVDNGNVADLNNRLRKFVKGNQSYWSQNYNLAIFVRTSGEHFLCIARSDAPNQFLMNSFSTTAPIEDEFYEDSHTYATSAIYGEDSENLQLVLVTPIYQESDSYDAIMILTSEQNRLIQKIMETGEKLLLYMIIWISILILVITLMSAHNVKSLKKAKKVVSKIAGGDFSVRVDKYSNDEVGEICAGVNHMADKLEEYFEEKNRNEQFYYKFVPEKFRELLHKEKFTDLALGDAKSEDLTILFCDIRAFSINSEMMTAKESFDFVNKIYGKAGPVIRKHNGFIDKYIGDAVMALFESADDAVATGIELYQAIALNTDSLQEFGLSSVKIGIGIHSGMARIGIVGEEERMSGTVISSTVNLSSRMEALTKRYGTAMIISKDTLDRMSNPDMLSTRYLGMVQVAGVNEVVALYEVLDCLEETQRKKREETAKEFREAVRLFHTGSLQQALEIFHKLEAFNSRDNASHLYADYIEEKLEKGDMEHNVFRFQNKE